MKDLSALTKELPLCLSKDRHSLKKKIYLLKKKAAQKLDISNATKQLKSAITQSKLHVQNRKESMPPIIYNDDLPISLRREEISNAIQKNQVIILCGETGSGKTTQLPKICLDLGRGITGVIGHTQPRRIAARSVAARISEELSTQVGEQVGYKVRFTDQSSQHSLIKLMTDGILLAETQADKFLSQYDTLIIDEAHERSLNIDFLLGYLKQILPRRPDLKLIITSATIDPDRFSQHFNNAPVIEVSGRTYPVEIIYQPLVSTEKNDEDKSLEEGILDAVDHLSRLGPGDILVFLPGEREIRHTTEALKQAYGKHHPEQIEILPLFARLSIAEQQKIFQQRKQRRIILSTNVAETSLTVPGIKYVIDSGTARISRYSYRTKIQRLPIEKISQSSANQRAGRCGRIDAGVCIRLFAAEDFALREQYITPEILRTNLASVILQMKSLKLGDVRKFPFVEPPDNRYINDGEKLLHELGALDQHQNLTALGKKISALPIDPKLGRILLAAHQESALQELLAIVSILSIQDPRERPFDHQKKADEKHQRFTDQDSDFVSLLNLWNYLNNKNNALSQNNFRKLCRAEFISYTRWRECLDTHRQLKKMLSDMNIRSVSEPASFEQIHRSLLTGLLGNIGMKTEKQDFLGARNSKFKVFPGSGLFAKSPKWMVSAEIVDSGKVYARTNAKISPDWLESIAKHLVKKTTTEPHWEKRTAQVSAFEKVSLYGLTIIPRRKVNYGPLAPVESREIFIQHALVLSEYSSKAPFFKHNKKLIENIEALEAKSRRQDILISEHDIYEFFDHIIPSHICSGHSFEKWRKTAETENPKLLYLDREKLMQHAANHITHTSFPNLYVLEQQHYVLKYHFSPGSEDDGVTIVIPLTVLNSLKPAMFDWLVPGLIEEKISYLLKSLPKQQRKNFIPVPQYASACVAAMPAENQGSLALMLSTQLLKMTGINVPVKQWNFEGLPHHLKMNFEVVDEHQKVLSKGRDLGLLQQTLANQTQRVFDERPKIDLERDNIDSWDFGKLPESIIIEQNGLSLRGYPAIVPGHQDVSLRLFDNPVQAQAQNRKGLCKLIILQLPQQIKYLSKNLPHFSKIALRYASIGNADTLKQDIIDAIIYEVFIDKHPTPKTKQEFEHRIEHERHKIMLEANTLCATLDEILAIYNEIQISFKSNIKPALIAPYNDMKQQMQGLIYHGFVATTPKKWLSHIPRFLKATQIRLQKLDHNLAKDSRLMAEIHLLSKKYTLLQTEHDKQGIDSNELVSVPWLIEELRVSLFAQELKTSIPISVKRIEKRLTAQ